MEVVILRGIPGSGKSTYMVGRLSRAWICSADQYFTRSGGGYFFDKKKLTEAHNFCLLRFVDGLNGKEPLIVVDNTNITAVEIAPYYRLAEAYGYDVHIKQLYCDPIKAYSRNVHGVSVETVLRMHHKLLQSELPFNWNEEVIITD